MNKFIDEIPTFDEFKAKCPIEYNVNNALAAFIVLLVFFSIVFTFHNVTVL